MLYILEQGTEIPVIKREDDAYLIALCCSVFETSKCLDIQLYAEKEKVGGAVFTSQYQVEACQICSHIRMCLERLSVTAIHLRSPTT